MKKTLLVSLVAVSSFVSLSWAWTKCTGENEGFCLWGSGCTEISEDASDANNKTCAAAKENCETNSASKKVYSTKAACEADYNPQSPKGCCEWESGTCWTIYTDTELSDCGSKLISTSACASSNGSCSGGGDGGGSNEYCYYSAGNCHKMPTDDNCENGTIVTDCSNPGFTQKYCDWGECINGSGYDCEEGGCYPIPNSGDEKKDCTDKSGEVVSSCPAGHAPPGTSPIVFGSTPANLTVIPQAGSLLVSSLKEATLSLFDMSGKQVFSQEIPTGYSTISLDGQKLGVYYAVVSSGSSKQTVKVVLK